MAAGIVAVAIVDQVTVHVVARTSRKSRGIIYETTNTMAADMIAARVAIQVALRIELRPRIDVGSLGRGAAGGRRENNKH